MHHTDENTDETTQLYRHFDAQDTLLYVGISLSAVKRLSQHRGADWFNHITRVTIEHYATRWAALDAEAWAIHHDKPLHNTVIPPCPKCKPEPVDPTFKLQDVHQVYRPGDIDPDRLVRSVIDGRRIRFIGWDGDGGQKHPSARTVGFLSEFAAACGIEYTPA